MYPLLELPYAQRPNHSFLTVPMAVRSHDGDLFVSDAGTGSKKEPAVKGILDLLSLAVTWLTLRPRVRFRACATPSFYNAQRTHSHKP